jgi:hypothetical protein
MELEASGVKDPNESRAELILASYVSVVLAHSYQRHSNSGKSVFLLDLISLQLGHFVGLCQDLID